MRDTLGVVNNVHPLKPYGLHQSEGKTPTGGSLYMYKDADQYIKIGMVDVGSRLLTIELVTL